MCFCAWASPSGWRVHRLTSGRQGIISSSNKPTAGGSCNSTAANMAHGYNLECVASFHQLFIHRAWVGLLHFNSAGWLCRNGLAPSQGVGGGWWRHLVEVKPSGPGPCSSSPGGCGASVGPEAESDQRVERLLMDSSLSKLHSHAWDRPDVASAAGGNLFTKCSNVDMLEMIKHKLEKYTHWMQLFHDRRWKRGLVRDLASKYIWTPPPFPIKTQSYQSINTHLHILSCASTGWERGEKRGRGDTLTERG